MDEAYATTYADLYQRHWWWRAREEHLVWTLRRIQPLGGWERILDVGCGDALFFDLLKDFGQVEGVEENAAIVDPSGPWASQIHIEPFCSAFEPRRTYGLILMLDVLEHLADPIEALTKSRELLVPHGHLVLTVPAFRALWTAHDEINGHVARFTVGEVSALVEQVGFRVQSAAYFFHWLCAVKLLVRLKERLLGRNPVPERVPRALFNRVFYQISRFEQRACRSIPLPFGTSVLVVATRERT